MAVSVNEKYTKVLNTDIGHLEKASTGENLRKMLYNLFLDFQNGSILFTASSIGDLTFNDLVTKKVLEDMFYSGTYFDMVPKEDSNKAVQSYGIITAFGDFKTTLNKFDKLIIEDD